MADKHFADKDSADKDSAGQDSADKESADKGMADQDKAEERPEEETSSHLTPEEAKDVDERKSGSARVVHEVIRLQGDEELERPTLSLLLSGIAAGVSISFSPMSMGFIKMALPDAKWADLLIGFGYTVGFMIVVLGRLQLFTETTVTAVLPVAVHPTRRNLLRLLRLWGLVFTANMIGTLAVAWLSSRAIIVLGEQRDAMVSIASELLKHDALTTLALGVPSGFLIASMAWMLPNARGSEFWVVLAITYIVRIGHFSHVVAGSSEAWMLWLTGATSFGHATLGLILPSLIGNIIGGTGLFAVLAHGQVRHEMHTR